MLPEITAEEFTEYSGIDAPNNWNRLVSQVESLFSRFNTDGLSEKCKEILKNAMYEQILGMMKTDIDSSVIAKSASLGDASASYQIRDEYYKAIHPNALRLLEDARCNFLYAGLSKKCCKRCC